MEEVQTKIRETEAKIIIAENKGDDKRRDRLEEYLIELQRKENLLMQHSSELRTLPNQSSTKEKRSSSKQDSFKKKLLRRHHKRIFGDNACEICSGSVIDLLEASHLVDLNEKKKYESDYDVHSRLPASVNDTANGLLLCPECHSAFDHRDRLLRLDPDGTIRVSGILLKSQKYRDLNGKKVIWFAYIDVNISFPSSELLTYVNNHKPTKGKRRADIDQESDESEEDELLEEAPEVIVNGSSSSRDAIKLRPKRNQTSSSPSSKKRQKLTKK